MLPVGLFAAAVLCVFGPGVVWSWRNDPDYDRVGAALYGAAFAVAVLLLYFAYYVLSGGG